MCVTGADISNNFPAFFLSVCYFLSDNSQIKGIIKEGKMPVSIPMIPWGFFIHDNCRVPSTPLRLL
jgi:hypothetical protein